MSTDFTPNDPRDAKPVPESAADEEPLLVEAVQEAEPVVTVRGADRRLRRDRRTPDSGGRSAGACCC